MSKQNMVGPALAFVRQLATDCQGGYHPDSLPEHHVPPLGEDERKLWDHIHQYLANRMVDITEHLLTDRQKIVLVTNEDDGETFVLGQPTYSFDEAVEMAQRETLQLLDKHPEWEIGSKVVDVDHGVAFWCLEIAGADEGTYSFQVVSLPTVIKQ